MRNQGKKFSGGSGKRPFSSSKFEKKGKRDSFKRDKDHSETKESGDNDRRGGKKSFDKPYGGSKFSKRGNDGPKKEYGTERTRKFKEKKYSKSDDSSAGSFDRNDKKPFKKRDFDKKDGGFEKKSYNSDREGGERKYGKRNDDEKSYRKKSFGSDKEGGERKYGKRNDDEKSYRKKSFGSEKEGGERKYGKRNDDEKSYRKKSFGSDKEGGERKYGKRNDDEKSYRKKSFGSDKEGGERKYGKRNDDENGYRKKSFDSDKEGGKRRFDKRGAIERENGESSEPRKYRSTKDDSSYEKTSYDKDLKYVKDYNEGKFLKKKPKKETYQSQGLTRLNKYLSNAGICSRREADDLIKAGTVTVNGKVITEMGYKIGPDDKVTYGGETLRNEHKVYLLLNKPKDYITTMDDPRERRTVMELINGACKERIYPVGRLDRNTTGLLLFTNDGEMATRLMHPKFGIRKIYQVTIGRNMKPEDFSKLMEGVELEDGFIKPDEVSFINDSRKEIGIEIHSGKNRIVRRIFEHLDYEILKLDRVSFAGLSKKDLPRGKWRFLTPKEVSFLKMVG